MVKHTGKSHSQKELHAKRKKESFAQMEPAMKKKLLSADKAIWYKSLDPAEKEKLLSHRAEWYKSLVPKEKEKPLSKSAEQRTLVEKSKIINMKPNCIYSMQPIEQHYYH